MRKSSLVGLACIALIGALASVGCDPPKPKANAPATAPTGGPVITSSGGPVITSPGAPASAAPLGSPLTDAQKKLFVDRALETAQGGNQPNDFIDPQKLFTKVADLVEIPPSQRAGFLQGAVSGYQKNSLRLQVTAETSKGGSLTFLRFSNRDGYETAIFRFLRSDGNMNYFEFALPAGNASNFSLASDVYSYVTGEWLSRTSANIGLQLKAGDDRSALSKLFNGMTFQQSDESKLRNLFAQMRAQNMQGVLESYAALPESMKKLKICLLNRYMAAQALQNVNELAGAVEEMQKHYPNDSNIPFISMDLYALRKEFGKVMNAIDALDKSVGGDPYLDVLRGSISFQANDFDQAIAAGKRAAEKDPTLEGAHNVIARAGQAKGDFAMVATAFRNLQAMGKITPADVAATAEFAPFVASPEFQAWQAGK